MILSEMFKKLLSSILLLTIVVGNLALPRDVSAQQWWAPTPEEFNDRVNDPAIPPSEIFGERYTHAQVYWIIYSIINFITDPQVQACAAGADGDLASFANCGLFADAGNIGGAFALANVMTQFTQARPATGIGYISEVATKIGFPEANAQEGGFGFTTALSPVISLWRASRNAAYALMTLAIVVLAFMIMFRTKISPQASVTVQTAIPRIIIGLLLITFSYAIAGFVIDMAYVVQGIIAALVYGSGLINPNGWTVIDSFNQMNDIGAGVMGYGLLIIAWALVIGGPAALAGVFATGGTLVIVGIIIVIIAIILFLIALVRVFWLMLRTYVAIIFHVIALPFAALGYVASPGGNMFMQILKSLIGNVSVFVSLTVVVMTAHLLFWQMSGGQYLALSSGVAGPLFNPYRVMAEGNFPTAGAGMPGFGATDMSAIGIFIGLVVLLTSASIANNIKELIITGRMGRPEGMMGAGFIGGVYGMTRGAALDQIGARTALTGARWAGTKGGGVLGTIKRGAAPFMVGYGEQRRAVVFDKESNVVGTRITGQISPTPIKETVNSKPSSADPDPDA